jgi:hypothetical protein
VVIDVIDVSSASLAIQIFLAEMRGEVESRSSSLPLGIELHLPVRGPIAKAYGFIAWLRIFPGYANSQPKIDFNS